MGAVRVLDPDLARRLVVHEARAQQTPVRELRDLGDGWLLHDPSDAEPFWNRLIAPRWPVDPAAFDRRLDEVITLFATLARLPHVRPLPLGSEPPDLAARLEAAGFELLGADRRLVLVEHNDVDRRVDAAQARVASSFGAGVVSATRHSTTLVRGPAGRRWSDRRRWASEAAIVLGDAFGVGESRRVALENDALACVTRPGCSMLLLRVDGEPAAIARRATTEDGTYLSSIGTRPHFRRQGLAAMATMLAVRDALEEGSPDRPSCRRDRQQGRPRPVRGSRVRRRRRAGARPAVAVMIEQLVGRMPRRSGMPQSGRINGSAAGRSSASAGRTVELERASVELAGVCTDWIDAPRDALLGAKVLRCGDGGKVLLLEPDTEGRLAASLARFGEGVVAIYLDAGADGDGEADLASAPPRLSRPEPGPLGPARLLLGSPLWGPNILVLDRPST